MFTWRATKLIVSGLYTTVLTKARASGEEGPPLPPEPAGLLRVRWLGRRTVGECAAKIVSCRGHATQRSRV